MQIPGKIRSSFRRVRISILSSQPSFLHLISLLFKHFPHGLVRTSLSEPERARICIPPCPFRNALYSFRGPLVDTECTRAQAEFQVSSAVPARSHGIRAVLSQYMAGPEVRREDKMILKIKKADQLIAFTTGPLNSNTPPLRVRSSILFRFLILSSESQHRPSSNWMKVS